MKKLLVITFCICFAAFEAAGQTKMSIKDAPQHLGDIVTICDKVYSTKLITTNNMVLLNLGGYYPNQLLTVVIKGWVRNKFQGQPELFFKGKSVCVTGRVVKFRGKPEIVVDDPADIKLNPIETPDEGH